MAFSQFPLMIPSTATREDKTHLNHGGESCTVKNMPTWKEYEIGIAVLLAYKAQSGDPAGVDGIAQELKDLKRELHPPGGPE